MILADENIHGTIIQILRDAGFDVISVRELSSGAKDEVIIQMAQQNGYVLLTEDKDFGEWIFAHHVKDLSVLFLRYSFQEFKSIANVLVKILENKILDRPFFATITTNKIRVRKL